MKRLVGVWLVLGLACATTPSGDAAKAKDADLVRLTLVGTNDVHGWIMPQTEQFPAGPIRYGGVATFASYLKVLRDENPTGLILLDAGDMFQGTLLSNISEGSAVIDAFNLLRYDAAAIGNHEFDYGPVGPVSAAQPGMDPFGALKARIAQAKFPMLSTNTYESRTGLRPAWLPGDGTMIIERGGIRVGIIGLTTPQTPSTTLPINVSTLKFAQLAPEALTSAKRLRENGADVVIAVVHAGGKCGDCTKPHDVSSCDVDSSEIFSMIRGLPYGTLDAVIAGHTHTQLNHFVNDTPVLQSFALGRYFGVIELYLDPQSRHVVSSKTTIDSAIPICETMDETTRGCDARALRERPDTVRPVAATFHGKTMTQDQTIAQALLPAEQKVAEVQNTDLGLAVPDTLGRNYENESALGSFLADSLRAAVNADIALLNPGGLRADLKSGPLSYGAVYEVLPFDNAVATIKVTGDELNRLLTAAYGSKKGVFQVSGLEVTLKRCPSPSRFVRAALPGGKPLDPAKVYSVVMPDFLARGGDGLGPVLATIPPVQVDLGENRDGNLRDELVAYWKRTKPSFKAPQLGRVIFTDEGACGEGRGDGTTRIP